MPNRPAQTHNMYMSETVGRRLPGGRPPSGTPIMMVASAGDNVAMPLIPSLQLTHKYSREPTSVLSRAAPTRRPAQEPRRGLPRLQLPNSNTVAFHATMMDTMHALSSTGTSQDLLAPREHPVGPKQIAMLDRTGLVPLQRPLVPRRLRQYSGSQSLAALPPSPAPVVPQRVLDARISPYSILRHSPSIAIQPNSDPPSFKCGGGHHLLRALEFPSNAQVEGEWRHLELMQKRSREMAERAEMVAKGLIPSASLPALRVRKIA